MRNRANKEFEQFSRRNRGLRVLGEMTARIALDNKARKARQAIDQEQAALDKVIASSANVIDVRPYMTELVQPDPLPSHVRVLEPITQPNHQADSGV